MFDGIAQHEGRKTQLANAIFLFLFLFFFFFFLRNCLFFYCIFLIYFCLTI